VKLQIEDIVYIKMARKTIDEINVELVVEGNIVYDPYQGFSSGCVMAFAKYQERKYKKYDCWEGGWTHLEEYQMTKEKGQDEFIQRVTKIADKKGLELKLDFMVNSMIPTEFYEFVKK